MIGFRPGDRRAAAQSAAPPQKGSLRGWFYAVGFVASRSPSRRSPTHVLRAPLRRHRAAAVPDRRHRGAAGRAGRAGAAGGHRRGRLRARHRQPPRQLHLRCAPRELRRHRIGRDRAPILVRHGPCGIAACGGADRRDAHVRGAPLVDPARRNDLPLLRHARVPLLLHRALRVLRGVPTTARRRIFFLLCVLFLLFFVCRLRPASYWWIDIFVQNTGTVSLFLLPGGLPPLLPHLPAAEAAPLRAGRTNGRRAAAALEDAGCRSSSRRARALLPDLLDSADRLPLRRLPAAPGATASPILSGAPLSSWVLLGDYLVLGPRRPGALGLHARGPARAPAGAPRPRRHDPRHDPVRAARHRAAVASSTTTTTSSAASCR